MGHLRGIVLHSGSGDNDAWTMKTILTIGNNPLVVVLSSLFGAGAIGYLDAALGEVIKWLIPVFMIILADLVTGVSAAKARGEAVRFSKGARRTINKLMSYSCWLICCVALNQCYGTHWIAWVGMGIVFLIEGTSFLSNLLEPHGIRLSIRGLLRVIGGKIHVDNLDEVIEK